MKLFTIVQNILRKKIVTYFGNNGNKHQVIYNKALNAKFRSIYFEIGGPRLRNKAS